MTIIAPPQVIDDRMQACSICEQHRGGFCLVCHCLLKVKACFSGALCPLGKWPCDEGAG